MNNLFFFFFNKTSQKILIRFGVFEQVRDYNEETVAFLRKYVQKHWLLPGQILNLDAYMGSEGPLPDDFIVPPSRSIEFHRKIERRAIATIQYNHYSNTGRWVGMTVADAHKCLAKLWNMSCSYFKVFRGSDPGRPLKWNYTIQPNDLIIFVDK